MSRMVVDDEAAEARLLDRIQSVGIGFVLRTNLDARHTEYLFWLKDGSQYVRVNPSCKLMEVVDKELSRRHHYDE